MKEIICRCMKVDKETLISKIKQGFTTLDEIEDETAAGSGCGGCRQDIEDLIEEYTKK